MLSQLSGAPTKSVSQSTLQNFILLGLQEDRVDEVKLLLNSNLTLNPASTDPGELWREVSEIKFIDIGKSGRKSKSVGEED